MTLSNFIEGLQIVQKYYDGDGYHIGADHDKVYLYPTKRPLSTTDVERMRVLDWFQPEMSSEEYDPTEGWMAYL